MTDDFRRNLPMFPRRGWLLVLACLALAPISSAVALPLAQGGKKAAGAKRPPTDRYGDPLPRAAVARMGTLRLRHGGAINFVGYAAGGKVLLSAGDDGAVRTWDAATGQALRHLPISRTQVTDAF